MFEVTQGKEFQAIIADCPNSSWQYEYALKDHFDNRLIHATSLINIWEILKRDYREGGWAASVVFADVNGNSQIEASTEILNESHYYPFGMEMEGEWKEQLMQDNNYRYNGKEEHREFGLGWISYGARFYDYSTGRFTLIDRFTE